ncbi:MAG TPA: hypothetical protein VMU40_07485 [Steroidobacteraceae bacterium]|nr:hypothetical protein [Steroidobacteraceae bacterium]
MMKGDLQLGAVVMALLATGCVVSTPIVPAGKNTYTVSSRSKVCLKCASASQVLQAANQFCANRGQSLVIHNPSGYMSPFGYNADNQLTFSCVEQTDPSVQSAAAQSGMIFVDPRHD